MTVADEFTAEYVPCLDEDGVCTVCNAELCVCNEDSYTSEPF